MAAQAPVRLALVAAWPGAHSEEPLAGLPLLLRAILRLARCGVEHIVVVGRDERDSIDDPRVTAKITEVSGSGWPDVFREAAKQTEPMLIARATVVAQPRVLDTLIRGDFSVDVAVAHRLGPLRVTPEGARALATKAAGAEPGDLGELLKGVEALRLEAPGWVHETGDAAGRARAFRGLFDDCRKSVDGLVARHLNRHVSIFISKAVVNTRVTPNQVSIVTFLFGLLGAGLVAYGSYLSMVFGAFFFQVNSILDGVDGELARVRFQQSRLGEWVDTIGDDVSNLLFYGALAIAASAQPEPGPTFALMGYAGVVLGALTMVLYYSELIRVGSGDFYALGLGTGAKTASSGPLAGLVTLVGYLTKKDFFIFGFLVAAVFGVLIYALPVILAGTVATFFAGVSLHLRRLRAR